MKALEKELRGHDCLIFLDLEGTQFSHEMIEIGAYKVLLAPDQSVKKIFPGFQSYVKAKAKVGRVVTDLTGITDAKIKSDGVPFRVVQQNFRKYVGKDWGKCLYVTFGSHDLRIIMQSAENNMDSSREEARYVTHNAFDLSEFISRFIKDEHDNSLSLTNYLKVFGVPFEGQAHETSLPYFAKSKRKAPIARGFRDLVAKLSLVKLLFEGFAGLESNTVAGRDFDLLLSSGIGAFASSALFLLENAKTRDLDILALDESLFDFFDDGFDNGFGVSLRDFGLLGDG